MESVVCEMAAILSQPQWVKLTIILANVDPDLPSSL